MSTFSTLRDAITRTPVSLKLACVGSSGQLTATNPWTWAAGDQIRLSITYRSTAS